jgi:hypothetical protein
MHQALRPYVTTGIAVVGASVLAAAPLTAPPQASPQTVEPLVRQIEVMPTALASPLGTISTAIGAGLQIGIDTVAGLPLGLTAAAAAIAADPEANTANVLNFLLYSFLSPDPIIIPNPADPTDPTVVLSTFLQFGIRVVAPLISLLPAPLQPVVGQVFSEIGNVIRAGLAKLPGNTVLGAYAVGGATIALAIQQPELYGKLTHIQDTGEAVGAKVFNFFSHGSAPGMMALRENDPQGKDTIAEDTDDSGKSGLPLLGHILHPPITPDADEVGVDVEQTKPSKPLLSVLKSNPLSALTKGPASSINGSLLGAFGEKEKKGEGSTDGVPGSSGVVGLGALSDSLGAHSEGPGKHSVRDVIKRITGQGGGETTD